MTRKGTEARRRSRHAETAHRGRLHGGVVPVPFLGTTWRQRGGPYWRRRVGAVVLFLVLLIFGGRNASASLGIAGAVTARPGSSWCWSMR